MSKCFHPSHGVGDPHECIEDTDSRISSLVSENASLRVALDKARKALEISRKWIASQRPHTPNSEQKMNLLRGVHALDAIEEALSAIKGERRDD